MKWEAAYETPLPPISFKEPVLIRTTRTTGYGSSMGVTYIKLYVVLPAVEGRRKNHETHLFATYVFTTPVCGGRNWKPLEDLMENLIALHQIRLGLDVMGVHWWGWQGPKKGG